MKSGMRNLPELNLINFCRALSIFIVLAQHANNRNHVLTVPNVEFIHLFYGRFTSNGFYGVCLFFVLSGFLITRLIAELPGSLYQPDFKDFYIRRTGRIIPLLTAVTLVGVLISFLGTPHTPQMDTCFKNGNSHYSLGFWLSICFFIFNWFSIFHPFDAPVLALNWGVLWSLSIEEQFYLFYPLALKFLRTEKALLRFLVFVIVSGPIYRWVAFRATQGDGAMVLHGSFGCFDQIAIGALLYLLSRIYGPFLNRKKMLAAAFCASGFAGMVFVFFSTNPSWGGQGGVQMILGPSAMAFGLFFFLLGGLHLKFFETFSFFKGTSFVGRSSYGMYLWHGTVLFFLMPILDGHDIFLGFGIFFGMTVLVSWVSKRYFEEPVNRWWRRRWISENNLF